MEKRQMWASPHLGKRGHYIRFLLGSIGGILLPGLLSSVGGAMVLMPLGTNKALPSLFLCLGTALLMGVLALNLGRKSAMEHTLFFEDLQGELYVFDARAFASGKVLDFFQGVRTTQRILSSLAENPSIPLGARKITRVEAIVPHRTYFLLRLQGHGPVYLLFRRLEGAEELVGLLQRKTSSSWGQNTREKKGLWAFLAAGRLCCFFAFWPICAIRPWGRCPFFSMPPVCFWLSGPFPFWSISLFCITEGCDRPIFGRKEESIWQSCSL